MAGESQNSYETKRDFVSKDCETGRNGGSWWRKRDLYSSLVARSEFYWRSDEPLLFGDEAHEGPE